MNAVALRFQADTSRELKLHVTTERRNTPQPQQLRLYGGDVAEFLNNRRCTDGPRLIVTPNLDHWRLLSRSRAFRSAYDAAAIVLNDSRFLMKTLLGAEATTYPGCELVLRMLTGATPRTKIMVVGCPPAVGEYLLRQRPDLEFRLLEPTAGVIFKRKERRAIEAEAKGLRARADLHLFGCAAKRSLFAPASARAEPSMRHPMLRRRPSVRRRRPTTSSRVASRVGVASGHGASSASGVRGCATCSTSSSSSSGIARCMSSPDGGARHSPACRCCDQPEELSAHPETASCRTAPLRAALQLTGGRAAERTCSASGPP